MLGLALAGLVTSHCGGGGALAKVDSVDARPAEPDKRPELTITSESGVLTSAQRDAALAAVGSTGLLVVDPGTEPRQRLTYAAGPSADQVLDTSVGVRVERTGAAVVDRAERGSIRVSFEQQASDIAIRATMIDPTESQAETLGISVTVPVSADGRTMPPVPPDGELRPCAADRESLREALVSAIVRLPNREVGVGARWQFLESKSKSGTEFLQLTNAELLAVQGNTLTISYDSRGYLVEGQASREGAIKRFSSTSTWRMTIDRTRLLPVLLEIKADVSTAGVERGKELTFDIGTVTTSQLRELRASDPAPPVAPACLQREQVLTTECGALISSVNTGQTVFKDIGSDAKFFGEHAKKVDAFGVAIEAVAITDEPLSKHRAAYRVMVSDMAQVLRDAARGESSVDKRINKIAETEDALVQAINTYCE